MRLFNFWPALSFFLALTLLVGCGSGVCAFGNLGECPNDLTAIPPNQLTSKVTIMAATAAVKWGNSTTLTASGGTPPYRFSVIIGSGTVVESTGVFTAPFGSGVASSTIRVVDSKYVNGTSAQDKERKAEISLTLTDTP